MKKQNKCKYCVIRHKLNSDGFYSEVYFCDKNRKYYLDNCYFCGRGECCGEKCEEYEPCQSEHENCQNTTKENPVDDFVCSNCGIHLADWHRIDGEDWVEYEFKYCPNCGAKVIE